jgi:hypothetical protein
MANDHPQVVHVSADFLGRLDNWRAQQTDRPERAEAMRRVMELGLAGAERGRPQSPAARAADLAEAVIDQRLAADTSEEERADRKRDLLKGPSTFRDVRKDNGAGGAA